MPPDSRALFATFARHESHLQRLILGHQTFSRQWVAESAEQDPLLADWLALQLNESRLDTRADTLPPAMRQQWLGWRHYYQNEYRLAGERFLDAWQAATDRCDATVEPSIANIALGLGKVYTRTGHWSAARRWLLLALARARAEYKLFAATEGYGALGELLLRAGQPHGALACMGVACRLLPPGGGQQAKQMNFLASTLMRNGALLRAESLLMTSMHMAAELDDADSIWHALARLQFLELRKSAPTTTDVMSRLAEYVPARTTPVATGFLCVGRALFQYRTGQSNAALVSLRQAQSHFSRHVCERAWASRLLCAMGGAPYQPEEELAACVAIEPVLPPEFESVLDRNWSLLPMPDTNGFARLLAPVGTVDAEAAADTSFFI